MKKLAIVTSHPIQYNAPLFRLLAARKNIQIKVFYTWGQSQGSVYDPGFGKLREWDIPLLDGYEYEFIENISKKPGSDHFGGIVNPSLIEKIKEYGADAVMVYGWAFKSHLKLMRFFKGKLPVMFRGDSTLIDEPKGVSLKKMLRRLFLRGIYRNIDKALYAGKSNRAYFEAHGVKNHRLVYMPHSTDNTRFAENDETLLEKARSWKNDLGIPSKFGVVLFAGKVEPKKDPAILLTAAKELPDLQFIIAGNGVMENELKEKAKGLNNISFLPFQNQSMMPVVYRLADVFVLPSRGPGETWGLAVNEAMASGCAILMSDRCGGAPDLIREGVNGSLFEAGDAAGLVALLRQMTKNTQGLQKMKCSSRELIKNFSFDIAAAAVEKTTMELCAA